MKQSILRDYQDQNSSPQKLDNKMSESKKIYETLKQKIIWGEIGSGTLLSEGVIAKEYGVSRTPVRKALSLLKNDALIISLPQRGHLVRTVSLQEVKEVFHLRELLEVEAITMAAKRVKAEDIVNLKEICVLNNNNKTLDYPEIHREFHTIIARASGNRILADFISQLLLLLQQVMINDPDLLGRDDEALNQEIEIISALEAHDEKRSREAMRNHIQSTLFRILKYS